VWEPVLLTDVAPPTSTDLARCHDGRARQYWDKGTFVSKALRDPQGPRTGGVSWDYVAVYTPGDLWDEQLPAAAYEGGPVVDVEAELRAHLARR
jgi:hypothetical protein